jgi:hypothetical protein
MSQLSPAALELVTKRVKWLWILWGVLLGALVIYAGVSILKSGTGIVSDLGVVFGSDSGVLTTAVLALAFAGFGAFLPDFIVRAEVRPLLALPIRAAFEHQLRLAGLRPRGNSLMFGEEERRKIFAMSRTDQAVLCAFGPWYMGRIVQYVLLQFPAILGMILVLQTHTATLGLPLIALAGVLFLWRRPSLMVLASWVTRMDSPKPSTAS